MTESLRRKTWFQQLDLVSQMLQLAATEGELSASEYTEWVKENGGPSYQTVLVLGTKVAGTNCSFKEAVRVLTDSKVNGKINTRKTQGSVKRFTDGAITDALQRFMESTELRSSYAYMKWYKDQRDKSQIPSYSTIRNHYGSFKRAIEEVESQS